MSLDSDRNVSVGTDASRFDLDLSDESLRAIDDDLFHIPVDGLVNVHSTPLRSPLSGPQSPPPAPLQQYGRQAPPELGLGSDHGIAVLSGAHTCSSQPPHFSTEAPENVNYAAQPDALADLLCNSPYLVDTELEFMPIRLQVPILPAVAVQKAIGLASSSNSRQILLDPISSQKGPRPVGLEQFPFVNSASLLSWNPGSPEGLAAPRCVAASNIVQTMIPPPSTKCIATHSHVSPEWQIGSSSQETAFRDGESPNVLDQYLANPAWTDNMCPFQGDTPLPESFLPTSSTPTTLSKGTGVGKDPSAAQRLPIRQQKRGIPSVGTKQARKMPQKRKCAGGLRQQKHISSQVGKPESAKGKAVQVRSNLPSSSRQGASRQLLFPSNGSFISTKPQNKPRAQLPQKRVPGIASASKYCHVCTRSANAVDMAYCKNIARGTCRKIICAKCASEFLWPDVTAAIEDRVLAVQWECVHCRGVCPPKAQCNTYGRINFQRRERGKRKRQEKAFESAEAAASTAVRVNEGNGATDSFADLNVASSRVPADMVVNSANIAAASRHITRKTCGDGFETPLEVELNAKKQRTGGSQPFNDSWTPGQDSAYITVPCAKMNTVPPKNGFHRSLEVPNMPVSDFSFGGLNSFDIP